MKQSIFTKLEHRNLFRSATNFHIEWSFFFFWTDNNQIRRRFPAANGLSIQIFVWHNFQLRTSTELILADYNRNKINDIGENSQTQYVSKHIAWKAMYWNQQDTIRNKYRHIRRLNNRQKQITKIMSGSEYLNDECMLCASQSWSPRVTPKATNEQQSLFLVW